MASLVQGLINGQRRLSHAFDRLLPAEYRVDGRTDFDQTIVPAYIEPAVKVYDVGGGSNPFVTPEIKSKLKLVVIGLDFDEAELHAAPPGVYDATICADLGHYRGVQDTDLVVCRSVLEHVQDCPTAIAGLASMLKPGGRGLIFAPSRNAMFARLNLLLPESLKRRLLFALHPHKDDGHSGFAVFYHKCTPRDAADAANRSNLTVELQKLYFKSSYFNFFAPLYVAWRVWLLSFRALAGRQAAETFAMVLCKAARAS